MMAKADLLINYKSVNIETAKVAISLYSRCKGIAQQYAITLEIINAQCRIAQALRLIIVPNRDQARVRASYILESQAAEYMNIEEREKAGVEKTNSGLCILEMHNADSAQLIRAEKLLASGQQLKKDPVDWAYSEFNLGVCRRNLAVEQRSTSEQFQMAWNNFKRADRVFAKNGGLPDNLSLPQNLAQTVRLWTTQLIHERLVADIKKRLPEIPRKFHEQLDSDAVGTASAIRSNPESYGLLEPPDWSIEPCGDDLLTDERSISLHTLNTTIDSDPGSYTALSLKWERHRLRKMFKSEPCLDQDAVDSLEHAWRMEDYERFFIHGRTLIGADSYTAVESYVELLLRLAWCLEYFRISWQNSDIERLLLRNESTFRFLACELGVLGRWEDCFKTLEMSRGLISSRTLQIVDATVVHNPGISANWFHVTHSPRATLIAGCREIDDTIDYFGHVFPDLPGRKLAQLFSSTSTKELGLLTAQLANSRKATLRAADRIERLLEPVANYILDVAMRGTCMVLPGGYYQCFPMASIRARNGRALLELLDVATAPSRTIALSSRRGWDFGSVTTVIAHEVPGLQRLKYAAIEPGVIRACERWEVVETPSTPTDAFECIASTDFLHFSGHSSARYDPLDSALLLNGGSIDVSHILDSPNTLRHCILSSCQSGLSHNLTRVDEFLSIQSAFFYRGCTSVIATLWPVGDFLSLCFAARFYSYLADIPTLNARSWRMAFRASVHWLRTSRTAEVKRLLAQLGISNEFPPSLMAAPHDALPFAELYSWGAFSLMTRVE